MDNLPVSREDMMKNLARAKASMTAAANTGGDFLKLTRDGRWEYGVDSTEVEDDALWVVDVMSLASGFVSWQDDPNKPSEKLGEVMSAVMRGEPLPSRDDLPNTGSKWSEQAACGMYCLTGADKGTAVMYATTSKGGVRAINGLVTEIMGQLSSGSADVYPVVRLGKSSYTHKRYGRIYTPLLEVKDWKSPDAKPEAESKPEAEAEAPAPAENRARRRVA